MGCYLFTVSAYSQTGWHWQNPLPSGNGLYGVSFSGDEGWAVGILGTVLHTRDAGDTWSLVDVGTKKHLRSVCVHDPNSIFVVGEDGLILFIDYHDGNINVTRQNSGTTETLYSVSTDPNGCQWIAGSKGTILRSTDLGLNWNAQNSYTSRTLYALHHIECTTALIAGAEGSILRTTDWGITWNMVPTATTRPLFSIHMGTFSNIRAGGQSGLILHSNDEGRTWNQQHAEAGYNINAVLNVGLNNAYGAGDGGTILETSDYGDTWHKRNTPVTMPLYGLEWQPEYDAVWAVGHYGALLKNSGIATDFSNQIKGNTEWLRAVHFFDEQRGLAVGNKGTLLQTSNGGAEWSKRHLGSLVLCAMAFVVDSVGWLAGESGQLWKTIDYGVNWYQRISGTSSQLNAICFYDADHGWAVGHYGTIIHTNNGGSNWTAQSSGTANPLLGVHFVSQEEGWAVGLDSTVLHTGDGGQNWRRVNVGASNNFKFNSVFFVDSLHGWIVGLKGSILLTTDGGSTWQEKKGVTPNSLNDVFFIDPNTGWVVGYFGTIFKTTDGGQSWIKQESNCELDFTAIRFVDEYNGWAIGENGTIMRTYDGGGVTHLGRTKTHPIPAFILSQNYPNPFNPDTRIRYTIPVGNRTAYHVQLKVFNIIGQEIATLLDAVQAPGDYEVLFSTGVGTSALAPRLTSGVYFYQLRAGDYRETKKMILLQ